jgi:AraC-like DNA-binding protein
VYNPVKDGVAKTTRAVVYTEAPPPDSLSQVVHCFWELRTETELPEDFTLHAVPDACVNIMFNQLDTQIAGVTQLHTTHTSLPLGREFHYAGIQLFPGVWWGDPDATVDHYIGETYDGQLPLIATSQAAATLPFEDKVVVFGQLVEALLADGIVVPNPVTAAILANLDNIRNVTDMAEVAALSPRQLQRTLRATTGFTPHDLLKVLRMQHSFRHDYLLAFADQSHFTHSFKKLTGLTPATFKKTFDV